MAAKKSKKKKLSKRKLKPQRPKVRVAKKRERASRLQGTSSFRPSDEMLEDISPLFRGISDTSELTGPNLNELMMTVLASEDMANEPELQEIIIDPILCTNTFVEVAEERGLDPDSMTELPEEEREDIQMQILEDTVRRLLTKELCQDILKGLNDLRLRMKGSGKREETARAAALQSFLSREEVQDSWAMIGLVQAIFHRSLTVGFEMHETSMDIIESDSDDEGDVSLAERLDQPNLVGKTEALMKKVPGLRGYLRKKADTIWEEGMEALTAGDFHLGLFNEEEIKGGLEIFREIIVGGRAMGIENQDPSNPMFSKDMGQDLVDRLGSYLIELFTPERLEGLRQRLATLGPGGELEGEWSPFVMIATEYMKGDDGVENEKSFLIRALIAEMEIVDRAAVEEEEKC